MFHIISNTHIYFNYKLYFKFALLDIMMTGIFYDMYRHPGKIYLPVLLYRKLTSHIIIVVIIEIKVTAYEVIYRG